MNNIVDALSLPDWYPQAFSHLDVEEYPRYMAGFTLGRQGVHCLRCQSSKVDAVGFIVVCPDNPKIRCQDCGYEFQLQAWRGI
ncbi:hypothetical protein C5470_14510 [Photorhabdus stackebrandtii]|uniref:Uncharacterized protein n=2 Tax=Photorhabdus stackebrandtii TaxID=1123042 RepID=A0A7X5TLV6_9GAMM|nr:hypothetical protein [Photorhabdus stackebrandtii]